MRRTWLVLCGVAWLIGIPAAQAGVEGGTPPALVETYGALADSILASKQAEFHLVHSILAMTYQHAEATLRVAEGKLNAGQSAGKEIETLAGLVAQLGNEGDASVAAVRKRLIEGGHHHHASSDTQSKYDKGFVIVTREARKAFLDAGKRIARLGASPDASALRAEWTKVERRFRAVCEGAGG